MANRPIYDEPLSQHARNVRSRELNKDFNRQRKVRLPLTAWQEVDRIAAQVGISVPGLLLALTKADKETVMRLRDWGEDAAAEHQHFMSMENEDGSRTRVRAGNYKRVGQL